MSKKTERLSDAEVARIQAENVALSAENALLKAESRTDVLTELPNRRAFNEVLKKEMTRAHRHSKPLVLCFADMDGLKFVNDTYGHPTGDKLLVRFAQLLCSGLRAEDSCARWGGDEFVLILPETSEQQARVLIDRLQREVMEPGLAMEVREGVAAQAKASFGFVEMEVYETHLPPEDPDHFIKRADNRLYETKLAKKLSTRGAAD